MIIDEVFLYDNRKPVFIMKVKLGNQELSVTEQYIGPILMTQENSDYDAYLEHQVRKLKKIQIQNEGFKEEYLCLSNYLSRRSD